MKRGRNFEYGNFDSLDNHRASHCTYYGYSRTTYRLYMGSSTSTGEIMVIRPYVRYIIIKLDDRNHLKYYICVREWESNTVGNTVTHKKREVSKDSNHFKKKKCEEFGGREERKKKRRGMVVCNTTAPMSFESRQHSSLMTKFAYTSNGQKMVHG